MDNSLEDKATTNFPDSKSQHSMAISLKRIADALEKLLIVPAMPELTPEMKEEWEKVNRNNNNRFMEYKR